MINNTISEYVRTMFDESRDGELTVGHEDDHFDCPVEWDEQTAEILAQQCGALVANMTELAGWYDMLKIEPRHLTREQLAVWDTYLKPFPQHGMDMETLQAIWEKFETGDPVTEEERELADRYVNWFEKNSLTRLPIKSCHPAQLINHAKRYCKLVRLNAPAVVLESEAKRFAEEFVLYHCMKR